MIQILSLLLIIKCLKLVQVHESRIDTSPFLFPLHWRSLQSSTKYLQTALHRLRDHVATLSECIIKLETATSIFFVIYLIWSCGHLPSLSAASLPPSSSLSLQLVKTHSHISFDQWELIGIKHCQFLSTILLLLFFYHQFRCRHQWKDTKTWIDGYWRKNMTEGG